MGMTGLLALNLLGPGELVFGFLWGFLSPILPWGQMSYWLAAALL